MKKFAITILIGLAVPSAQAQTVDSSKCGYVVNIQPVKVRFTDTLNSQYLKAVIAGDNMVNAGTFSYQLLDSNCACTLSGDIEISGSNYTNWTKSNSEAFLYIADKIGVAIKED